MTYSLHLVTPPASEPVTLADAKTFMRVSFTDDDALITELITIAREAVEAHTERALMPQTWELRRDDFPESDLSSDPSSAIVIPGKAPLVSVTSIVYTSTSGSVVTLDPSTYIVDPYAEPGRIGLVFGQIWPVIIRRVNTVVVTFTAGYADAAHVPERLKLGIKMLVAHWYENREPVSSSGAVAKEIPWTIQMVIQSASARSFF